MNVSLTSKLEGMVKKLVKTGRYSSASEVVRDGLRLIDEREQLRQIKLQALKEAIKEGRESGESIPFDAEDIIKRGRERLKSSSVTQ
ncbi:MAG: type II toxin-antitoxin system ParD family antitoxin [Bacteroidetes bacterium]|nr:type II toxin-antitoxin system ParD family antitoxin [Bacteroidota bacterium]